MDIDYSKMEPMTWTYVKTFHLNPPKTTLPRQECVIGRYNKNMKIIKATKTIQQHLMEKYFSDSETIVLVPNEYPYFTVSDVSHYLLWIHPSVKVSTSAKIREIIDTKIQETVECKEYIYFENNLDNKSIPDIRHFHIFIRF